MKDVLRTSATDFINLAFMQAESAAARGEIPIGAVLVIKGEVIAKSGNRTYADHDPSAHAEIMVLREAGKITGSPRLEEADLYVTLEPCAMCAAAISHARIRRLYFAAYDPKGGAVDHGPRFFNQPTCHHAPEVIGGIEEQRGTKILKKFLNKKGAKGWSKPLTPDLPFSLILR